MTRLSATVNGVIAFENFVLLDNPSTCYFAADLSLFPVLFMLEVETRTRSR